MPAPAKPLPAAARPYDRVPLLPVVARQRRYKQPTPHNYQKSKTADPIAEMEATKSSICQRGINRRGWIGGETPSMEVTGPPTLQMLSSPEFPRPPATLLIFFLNSFFLLKPS